MEGEASSEFQEWEMLHNSESGLVNSPNSVDRFQGMEEGESEGMIKSDYFSLDNQGRFSSKAESEAASVDSDNPSWIDPGSDTRFQRNNSAHFWSDSCSDRSDDRKFSDLDVKNELGIRGFGEIEAKSENSVNFDVKNEVGIEGVGEIDVQDKDLGKFWSDSGGDGLVSMKFGEETEVGFVDHVKTGDESGGNGSVVAIEEMKPVSEEEKRRRRRIVWWKVPFEVLKYCVFKVSPVWTFSMAAALMGILILGRRLYKMKRKTRSLELKVTVDDKKVSQFMSRAARLNEAFSVVRRVPIVRPSLPAAGVNPWPVMSLR